MTYLGATAAAEGQDWGLQARQVVAAGGPGLWRQVVQLLRLRLVGKGLSPDEYYSYSLWRHDLRPEALTAFLPMSRRTAYVDALLLPGGDRFAPDIVDKLRTEIRFVAGDVACVRSLAVIGDAVVPEGAISLRSEAEIAGLLADRAVYPLFLKPVAGTFAAGAIGLTGVDGDRLQVLNRGQIDLGGLAAELASASETYVVQPLVPMHRDLARHTGGAVPGIRIVTLRTADGPRVHYAVLRMPARTAMHDGASRNPRLWAAIDLASGRLAPGRYLRNPAAAPPSHWADPDVPLSDLVMPHWQEALDLVVRAHDCYPLNGYLGWDVFLTPDGPLINEVNGNANPVWQPATGTGVRQGPLEALYQRALAYARAERDRSDA